jgi:membrane-bound serine protease (ClpP class)
LRINTTAALICAYLSVPTLAARPIETHVVEVKIDGIIHPVTVEIVSSALGQASREKDDAILLTLSTPGGLMDSTRQIVGEILHSPVPVIVWVGPSGARAASADFFLLESGDIALLRSVVERADHKALDNHLIDVIAPGPAALLRQLEGRQIKRFDGRTQKLHFQGTEIVPYRLSLRERVLSAIADPNIALLLLILGVLGIYAEFSLPGLIAPGVIGSVLALLGLTSLALFPIDWLGAALMLLGLIFFALEAKFGTHGILTGGGAIAMLLGSLMLIDTSVPELRIRWTTAFAVTLPFAPITSFLLSIALRARRNKVVTRTEAMLGETGITSGELNPSGTVMFHGEYWNAQSPARVEPSTEHERK